tara:strand:+ start:7864 stop:8364 length:501 start_codon:yes stop_codon:yes gene_type:complete
MILTPPQQKEKPKRPDFKVVWMGKKDPTHNFEKYFFSAKEAKEYADKMNDALVMKFVKRKDNGQMWEILPTDASLELIKNIQVVRKIKEKYSSADGEINPVTTQSFDERKRKRLVKAFVFSPFLIYTGIAYNLPTWIRVGLVATGAYVSLNEIKYLLINRKLQKSS